MQVINHLTGAFKRKLLKDEIVGTNLNEGWKTLLKYRFPPSNSLLISRMMLFRITIQISGSRVPHSYEIS